MKSERMADALTGNELEIHEHEGYVYFQVTAKHGGTTVVSSSLRINRDEAMLKIRRFVLT